MPCAMGGGVGGGVGGAVGGAATERQWVVDGAWRLRPAGQVGPIGAFEVSYELWQFTLTLTLSLSLSLTLTLTLTLTRPGELRAVALRRPRGC